MKMLSYLEMLKIKKKTFEKYLFWFLYAVIFCNHHLV